MTPYRMAKEIFEQPELLRAKANAWQEQAEFARTRFGLARNVVLIGRGSSGNACTFESYLYAEQTGRHPIEFRPWLSSVSTKDVDWTDAIVHAYSVSGQSTDIVQAAKWLRERGAFVIGVTNAEGACGLASAADELVALGVGPEEAIPATKTFCAQLFVAAALSGLSIVEAANETAGAMTALLDGDAAKRLSTFLQGARTSVWVARGPALAAALDAALKMQETAGLPCTGLSAAEFLHGPIGALGADDRAVLLADEDLTSLDAAISALLARRVPFIVIGEGSSSPTGYSHVSLPIPLPSQRWAKTSVFAVLSQRAALELAIHRGLDPDAPRGLSKVTLTT